jgi:hypothetical protein
MTVIMENLTVDGTYEYALNITPHAYNYLEGLPSNSTSISEFSLETPAEYAYVNITYNYTNLLENITNERSLRVFKCHSAGNCTWQEINEVEIDTENNTLKIQVYNLSVFSVSESIRTVNSTQTVTVAGPSGGGGGGATRTVEKEVTKIVQMDVITQPFVSTLAEETVTVPVAIINNGEKDLTDIQLSTDASSSDVSADLAPTVIGSLPSGSMTYVDMTLTSPKLNGTYQVTISAESADPAINTSSIIYMEVNDKYLYNRTLVETKLDFITQLIEENPECADLTEFFDKAKEEYAKENFDKAYSLTMSAINSCRSLISLREKNSRVKLDIEKPGSTYQYLWLITGVIVLVLLVVLFLAVLDFIYRRKRSNTVHHEQKRKRIFI